MGIFHQKVFVPMCTHSMEFDSFYRAGIYRRPCRSCRARKYQIIEKKSTDKLGKKVEKSKIPRIYYDFVSIRILKNGHFSTILPFETSNCNAIRKWWRWAGWSRKKSEPTKMREGATRFFEKLINFSYFGKFKRWAI